MAVGNCCGEHSTIGHVLVTGRARGRARCGTGRWAGCTGAVMSGGRQAVWRTVWQAEKRSVAQIKFPIQAKRTLIDRHHL